MNKLSWVVFSTLALAGAARAAEDAASDDALEEVVVLADRAVVATKTATLLVEIPQSVSIVTADQIAERGVFNYQDVFRYTAGVDTERFGDDQRGDSFSARGFALKQYLDGLNKTPNFVYGSRIETFTLERAEVLRGPSAVLYGAGSAGGLLNAVSKRPKFEFGGELGLEVGDYKRRILNADFTGPLGENFAGRFVGVARDAELMSPGQKNDKYVAMPSVTWKPSERTELTLIGLYQKEDLGTQTYLPMEKTLNASSTDPSIPIDAFVGEPGFNHMKTDQYAGTVLFSHRFNDLISVESNTRYIDQKVDYAEVYGYGFPPYADPERTLLVRQFYVLDTSYTIFNTDNHALFDFETGGLTHKMLLGVDYTKFNDDRQEGYSCPGYFISPCWPSNPVPALNVYDPDYGQPFDYGFTSAFETKSTQLGYYLQDQMKFNKVSFVLGARRDEVSSETTFSPEETTRATTYKAGVIAELLPGFSPFLSYSESFEPILGSDAQGNPFDPQDGRQYEGGIKWQPNPNSLITASYFDIEENNLLTQDPNDINHSIQGGKIGSKGYELEAIFNFEGGFGLTANYSHTKAEVLETTTLHTKGDRLEDLPEDLASLWANKTFTVNDDLAWRIGAGVRYVGDKIDYYQLVTTPSVTLWDAMAQVSWRTWYFALNVNNVADKEYYASCGGYAFPDGSCNPGQTRTVVGSITKKF
jgi:iron complex outermembrane receptor protein